MRTHRRVAVAGCAGSGKTLLAVAKAKELAAQGFRVLLTCFNRALASHLEGVVEGVVGLEVRSFHQLCRRLALEAEVALDWPAEPTPDFFDRDLPEALVRSVDRLGPRYDAIVVDEAQDFAASWWDALLLLMTDPDAGVLFVFYDDNQALYDRPRGLPSDMFEFSLSQNWRNTQQINDQMIKYYKGPPIRCMGPAGTAIEVVEVEPGISSLRTVVGKALHRLHVEEGVPTHEIVVLTPRSADESGLRGTIGSFRLVEDLEQPRDVRLSSIHGFKGLDAKVVVLAGLRLVDADFRELMYVGCSRARSHLVLLEQR
jgi:superfamily I DNA/RNA helicase